MKNLMLGLSLLAGAPCALAADVYTRIDACEQVGGGSCVFDLLRELAGRSTGGGGGGPSETTAYITYSCNSSDESLEVTATNAATRETHTFSYDEFARWRFTCVSSFLDDLNQVSTIRGQRLVAACDPRSLMVMKFRLSPIAAASFAGYGEQYLDLNACRAAAAAVNR